MWQVLRPRIRSGISCGLRTRTAVPDHLLVVEDACSRLPHEVHEKVFGWVLALVAERGLVKGERIGVDGSNDGGHRCLRTLVRRDSGEICSERC